MVETLIFSFDRPVSAAEFRSLADQTDWAREEPDIVLVLQGCFAVLGVWDGDRLIGVARVISDGVYNAQVVDVIVDEAYRARRITFQMHPRYL